MKICEICGKSIEDRIYKVMIYREDGTQNFVEVDSEECAKDLRHKNFVLHQRRADDVINQCIQRIK